MENKQNIKNKLKSIPKLPGIYKMLDSRGHILYIGKSKCLQNRVRSYFVSTPKWEKVNRMVTMIRDIDYIVTDTHLEARLLECRLIKEYKPRFNAQMKNDQSYFFIKVDSGNRNNPLLITEQRTEDCFGPFRSKYRISEFLDRLKNLYPISKIDGRYSFEYQMFPAPLDEEAHRRNRDLLLELFRDEDNIGLMMEALQTKLEEAATAYRYELASVYRDMLISFRSIQHGLIGYKKLVSKDILLTIPLDDSYKLFLISKGYLKHSRICDELTQEIKDQFIEEAMQSGVCEDTPENEKMWIDYRDILYSEISDLSEDMIEIL
jgi:excinuclease ABC subunit C